MKTLLVLALLSLTGCSSIHYKDPSGAEFSSNNFLNARKAGKVVVKAGDKSLAIEGYNSDQTEVAAAVAAAVASALVPKP